MDKCYQMAALYVASLKAIVQIHQHNHWTTKGENFYGDHLLFSKIYDSAIEDLDLAAEKFIGVFSVECLDYDNQFSLLNKILSKYSALSHDPVKMSITIEKDFLKMSQSARKCFESENKLTLGLDDMLASIASSREEAVYLLKQRLNQEI